MTPKEMLIREAIQNCIEAIGKKQGKVLISKCDPNFIPDISDVAESSFEQTFVNSKKLVIANDCPMGGLTPAELREASDVASSIDKIQSNKDNFGQGIVLTGCAANKFGFLWITRVGTEKFLVWLRFNKEENQYERYDFYDTLGESREDGSVDSDVLNITDISIPELDEHFSGDYNAYIFLGDTPKQDTTLDPFNEGSERYKSWLPNMLYERFAHIPKNVKIETTIQSRGAFGEGIHEFKSRMDIFEDTRGGVKKEIVSLDNGMKIHYHFDPDYKGKKEETTASNRGSTQSQKRNNVSVSPGFSSYVYKGEHYDVHRGVSNKALARHMGIPYGARNLTVHLEIPEGDYSPDSDRRYIEHDGTREPLQLANWTNLIKNNRPEWFIEKIEELKPKIEDTNAQDILERVAEKFAHVSSSGFGSSPSKSTGGGGGSKKPRKSIIGSKRRGRTPTPRGGIGKTSIKAPVIHEIFTMQQLNDASVDTDLLKSKIAQYDQQEHSIWLNYTYLEDRIDWYMKENTYGQSCDEDILKEITTLIRSAVIECVGEVCIMAYYKMFGASWTSKDVEDATSMAALTNLVDIHTGITNIDMQDKVTKQCDKIRLAYEQLKKVA